MANDKPKPEPKPSTSQKQPSAAKPLVPSGKVAQAGKKVNLSQGMPPASPPAKKPPKKK